jgi:Tol biopolymer transport system component/DNA-binding winged helix-turn-helix (wHTH) protein
LTPTKARGVRFSVFEADLHLHELRKHGIRIKLPGQPFQALALLLEHAGEVVTREEFRQALWPNETWGEHDQRLNKIVNKIREALSDSAETPRYIETVPRIGYRFLFPVERIENAGAVPLLPELAGLPEAPPLPSSVPRPTLRIFAVLASGLLVVGLVAGVVTRWFSGSPRSLPLPDPVPLTTYVGSELFPSLSPDGKRIVFAWDGEAKGGFHIYVASASGGGATPITSQAASDGSPVWSPDGREIAFLRDSGSGTAGVWLIQPDGSGARKLGDIRTGLTASAPSWTRDRQSLILSQPAGEAAIPALFQVSTGSGEERQITFPTAALPGGDLSPAVSPDGAQLAFTRSTSISWRDIFLAPVAGHAAPVRLTDAKMIVDRIAWTPNGRALVFAASNTTAGSRHLFRVDVATRRVTELGIEGDYPTIAGNPPKLAFVRKNIEQSSVWRLTLNGPNAQPARTRLFSSTRRDYTAELSPDGSRIVFSSVRSGSTEIWMSRPDGSDLRRLTSTGGSSPRLSPDGKRVVFENNRDGHPDLYVLTIETGAVARVTSGGSANRRASWSRDGRFLYYASNRSGTSQIWKLPSEGGTPTQITHHGGLYAVEAFDGKSIYYVSSDAPAQLWTVPSNGGAEAVVLPRVVGFSGVAMAPDGVYYLSKRWANGAELSFYQFRDGTSRILATIDHPVHPVLSNSHDGASVFYSQVDRQDTDLMMLDPFSAK